MKHHLAGTHKEVAPCPQVPEEIRNLFIKILDDASNDDELECFDDKYSPKKGSMDSFMKNKKGGSGSSTMKQQTLNSMVKDRDMAV
ncbi:hypothetical protein QN277_011495 [Acacia crassicarpa]|uniref:Uncharacterized protein n=1 Tax=Acacia crassicarpa TaxID=499986 RepID=A0AAE1MYM7_9FABA|nr:hypothetical protein QN277_011495 [Acacia crassicarpa]